MELIKSRDDSVKKKMKKLKLFSQIRYYSSTVIKFIVAASTLIIGFKIFNENCILQGKIITVSLSEFLSLISAILLLIETYFVNPSKKIEKLAAASNALYRLLIDRGVILNRLETEKNNRNIDSNSEGIDSKYIRDLNDLNNEYATIYGKINEAFATKQPAINFAELKLRL